MIIPHESPEEVGERLELVLSGMVHVEIPDECDAYPDLVHAARLAVCAVLLLYPAGRDFDLTVTLPQSAVVDEKMVAQAVPESPVFVGPVHLQGFADIRGGVVHDDVFPPGTGVEGDDVSHPFGAGDDKFLTDAERFPGLEVVCGIDGLRL